MRFIYFCISICIEIVLFFIDLLIKFKIKKEINDYKSWVRLSDFILKLKKNFYNIDFVKGRMFSYKPLSESITYIEKDYYTIYECNIILHELGHSRDSVYVKKTLYKKLFADVFLLPISLVGLFGLNVEAICYICIVLGNIILQLYVDINIYKMEKEASNFAVKEIMRLFNLMAKDEKKIKKLNKYAYVSQLIERGMLIIVYCMLLVVV